MAPAGPSSFHVTHVVIGSNGHRYFHIENPRLWWPRRCGEADLYDVVVRLLRDGVEIDRRSFRHGLRTIELDRTDLLDADG